MAHQADLGAKLVSSDSSGRSLQADIAGWVSGRIEPMSKVRYATVFGPVGVMTSYREGD